MATKRNNPSRVFAMPNDQAAQLFGEPVKGLRFWTSNN
jgi:hypothetical protein